MGGGLMQLVAYGAQDIYLTGNPQITFFKAIYKRHTNFAIEAIEQTFTGSVDFGRKISCTIDRNGDLVGRMYLEIDMIKEDGNEIPSYYLASMIHRFGHALIKEVDVEIGGQCIDKHYGEWLEIWSQLTCTDSELTTLRTMISGGVRNCSGKGSKLYIPLQFWFNRNPGLALPLIALQYHEVKITVALQDACKLCLPESPYGVKIGQVCLFCDYIFLDTDERRRFAQVSHEYLIEQLQFNNITSVCAGEQCANIELRFNHPCKELVWVVQPQEKDNTNCVNGLVSTTTGYANTPFRFSQWSGQDDQRDTVCKAKLQLNGHDRFTEREGTYFRCVQPFQHHTGGHRQGGTSMAVTFLNLGVHGEDGYIYTYSFGLNPEKHQPSGTCNFSRIDNANLQLNLNIGVGGPNAHGTGIPDATKFVKVYATNYNVLRVMSGMGGLAYSN